MGFRFKKSVSVAPGVKLNINKKSAGVSVGTKGAHYTVNSKGKRTASVGVPGTGVSYSKTKGVKSKSGASSLGCGMLIVLFVLFAFIMAGIQYLIKHPAVGISVAVLFVLAVIIAIVLFVKKKKSNDAFEENLDISSETSNVTTDISVEKSHAISESHSTSTDKSEENLNTVSKNNDSVSDNKIHAQLTNCYSAECQRVLSRVYRNKNSDKYNPELSFESFVENNEDFIKVFVGNETVGLIDKDSTSKLLEVLSRMESCLFDVRSRTDEGERIYVASIHVTFKK